MASIHQNIHVDADADDAWDAVRDFGAVHERVARGFVTDTRARRRRPHRHVRQRRRGPRAPRRRSTTTAGGSSTPSSRARSASPTTRRQRRGDRRRRRRRAGCVWTTDVLPDTVAPTIGSMMDAGRGGDRPRHRRLMTETRGRGRAADDRRVLEDDVPQRQGAAALPRRRAARTGRRRPGDRLPPLRRRARSATAQAIRRFRDLDMPIDEVRQVLAGARPRRAGNRSILEHLERMHEQLEQTQASGRVAAGAAHRRAAGRPPTSRSGASRRPRRSWRRGRSSPSTTAPAWLEPALADLHAGGRAGRARRRRAGRRAVPRRVLRGRRRRGDGVRPGRRRRRRHASSLAAATVAVLVHDGPFADLDQAYGALGTLVAERGIGGPGPIREHYLTETSTEVCWPVSIGAAGAPR